MKNRRYRYLLYIILRIIIFLIRLLPYRLSSGVGSLSGSLVYFLLPQVRRQSAFNLANALGAEKTPRELTVINQKVFKNLGRNLTEALNVSRLHKDNIDKYVKCDNLKLFSDLRENGKGVIVLSPHFGNWELVPVYAALKGYPVNVIARRLYYEKFEELISRIRAENKINVIYRDQPARKILNVLKANEILGILPDQDVDSVEGVFVDFFGQPAYTPSGPVALAMANNTPLVTCFLVREGNCHRLIIEEPISLENTGDKERDIKVNTEKWSKVFETYIRRYPEQWVWMHRRWKTKESQE